MPLAIKDKSACRWDQVSLGEVMLRLDPGEGRVHTTRTFQVWEGGGEYNVARGLKRCFGLDTAVVTALVDNAVGRLVQDLIYQGGVDQSHVRWAKDDGVGRTVRNGLNFTERGIRRARGPGLLGPRAYRGLAAQAGRHRLGSPLREGRRALVPHRRHLRRSLRHDPGRGQGGDGGGPPPRHRDFLRPQLPAFPVEVDRRPEARAGGAIASSPPSWT
jgi:hypothetical protein